MENVAKWLRHWTQDQGVWGSTPTALVMGKSLGQALNLHCNNGYQVEQKLLLCEWLQLQKIVLHSPRGYETVKSEFQYIGVINVKSAELMRISGL